MTTAPPTSLLNDGMITPSENDDLECGPGGGGGGFNGNSSPQKDGLPPVHDEDAHFKEEWWNVFRSMPREAGNNKHTFEIILKIIKIFCYVLFFFIITGSVVVSKFSLLILIIGSDSSFIFDKDNPLDEEYRISHRNIATSLLLVCASFPNIGALIISITRIVFGHRVSAPWKYLLLTIIVDSFHLIGLSLLLFRVFAKIGPVNSLIVTVITCSMPGLCKVLLCRIKLGSDTNTTRQSRQSSKSAGGHNVFTFSFLFPKIITLLCVVIQFGGPFLLAVYENARLSATNTLLDKLVTHNSFLKDSRQNIDEMAKLYYELPLATILISVLYWENFVDSDLSIGRRTIPLIRIRAILATVRVKTTFYRSIYKVMFLLTAACLLCPDFSLRFLPPSSSSDHSSSQSLNPGAPRVAFGTDLLEKYKAFEGNCPRYTSPEDGDGEETTYPYFGFPCVKCSTPAMCAKKCEDLKDKGCVSFTFIERHNDLKLCAFRRSGALCSHELFVVETADQKYTTYVLKSFIEGRTLADPRHRHNSKVSTQGDGTFNQSQLVPDHYSNVQQLIYYAALANVLSGLVAYIAAILACKLCIQVVSFTCSLTLATPLSLALMFAHCEYKLIDFGIFYWDCPDRNASTLLVYVIFLTICWLTQLCVCAHIWFPKSERLVTTDRLFVLPFYCGVLLEQSLMLNRRRNDKEIFILNKKGGGGGGGGGDKHQENETIATVTTWADQAAFDCPARIIACATMWHETVDEMSHLLKSVFRMDIDQSARRNARQFLNIRDPDYYEYETHIYFDDCMQLDSNFKSKPNQFVAQFMDVIDDAASFVHGKLIHLEAPVRVPTPYGGRLIWTLPGGTKLFVHLKDKIKIRHRKRWSQVMYMYYLLGYRLLGMENCLNIIPEVQETIVSGRTVRFRKNKTKRPVTSTHFTKTDIFNNLDERVQMKAENTFILTLDGDVDFQPDAVRLLLDRMKKNNKCGSSCGRIHPTGTGPLVWFQKFEYATAHWLQKAAEHVFGCVLCSPGCFSLFRASALMDDNVMRTYATRATEARHYVQYDQGEDRWLCTLLLQQGYLVEYSAAADAYTHAPETFQEFFNQRKRWGPSTLSNIFDLLQSTKTTVVENDNFSHVYMFYQMLLFISTLLAPATIVGMIAGSFNAVFRINLMWSYLGALLPPAIFTVIAFFARPKWQINAAAFLSAAYAIVMLAVVVGTTMQALEESITSPNAIFMGMLVIIFFTAACFHPEEFTCIFPGAIYFLCIPSGYLLLLIYSLVNMNNVSWGTREIPSNTKVLDGPEAAKKKEENKKKKEERSLLGRLGCLKFLKDLKQFYEQTIGRSRVESGDQGRIESLLVNINGALVDLPARMSAGLTNSLHESVPRSIKIKRTIGMQTEEEDKLEAKKSMNESSSERSRLEKINYDWEDPDWIHDKCLGDGYIGEINRREANFWKQVIAKYLHPLPDDKAHKEKVASELATMRNNVVFAFIMMNVLWLVIVFMLQMNQDLLKFVIFVPIPRGDDLKQYEYFEPLGLIFLFFFAIILLVQFVGMFIHRGGTLLHLLAVTKIGFCQRKSVNSVEMVEAFIDICKHLQNLQAQDPADEFILPPQVVEPLSPIRTDKECKDNFVKIIANAPNIESNLRDTPSAPPRIPGVSVRSRHSVHLSPTGSDGNNVIPADLVEMEGGEEENMLQSQFRSRLRQVIGELNRRELQSGRRPNRHSHPSALQRYNESRPVPPPPAPTFCFPNTTNPSYEVAAAPLRPPAFNRNRSQNLTIPRIVEDLDSDKSPETII